MSALFLRFRFRSSLGQMAGVIVFCAYGLLGGCSTNKDDQDFFERGWWRPRDLDKPDRPVTPRDKADAEAADDQPFDE
ncbi:MAG: hypothetical protein ABI680_12285 [Chthoniobacteraceae bacterium]